MQQFGSYRVIKHLGDGAMGAVHLVESPQGRRYALKLMHAAAERRQEAVDRFTRELHIALALKHPHIVETFHGGQAPTGGLFLLTEFCPGGGLDRWLATQGRIALEHALRWLGELIRALDYASREHRMVHRDIKPANLLLDRSGGVKLADLGLAKRYAAGATDLTSQGSIIGALLYMSPEQAGAETELDLRTDLYAVGATFYHLLTGHPPFTGRQPAQVLADIRGAPHAPLARERPELPRSLGALVDSLLAKRREDRPATATQALAEVDRIARDAGVLLEVPGPPSRPAPPPHPFA